MTVVKGHCGRCKQGRTGGYQLGVHQKLAIQGHVKCMFTVDRLVT
jgi:hypothetical protein